MQLDIRTLIVVYIAVSAVLTLIMGMFWRLRRATPGWGVWTVGVGATSVGSILVVLRDALPDFPSIVIGNGMVLFGTTLIWSGLRLFGGRRPFWWGGVAATLLLTSTLYYFRYVNPDLQSRFVVSALSMTLSFGACAWECFRNAQGRPHVMDRVSAGLFGVMAAASLIRTVLSALAPPADAFAPTWGQQANFFAIIIDAVLVVVCLLSMASERLLRQLEERGEALRRLAEDRDRAAARSERANEAKSRFLAMMSHEVRTPMTGVIGAADLLLTMDDDPERLAHLRALRASAGSLMKLLDEILDFSRIEAGKLSIAASDVDVAALLAEVRALFLPAASAKGLNLTLTVGPGVPALVRADPTRLRQVLLNLAGNAVKFTEAGSVDLALHRAAGDAGTHVAQLLFEVRDSGIGMDRSQVERLFQPFEQADSSVAHRYGGTGLGLTISSTLVHAMGGRIEVDSRLGGGSVFQVHLPCPIVTPRLAAAPAAAEQTPSVTERTLAVTADRHARILLADDEPTNRGLIAAVLRRMGHQVHEVEDGHAAVEAVGRHPFDLVILDMRMPGLDGPSAARHIRDMPGRAAVVRIIGLSADAMAAERERYMGAGLDAYLTKPVDWPALRAEVDLALSAAAGPGAGPDSAAPGAALRDLKGAAAGLGADRLVHLLHRLEAADTPEQAEARLAELTREAEAARAALRA